MQSVLEGESSSTFSRPEWVKANRIASFQCQSIRSYRFARLNSLKWKPALRQSKFSKTFPDPPPPLPPLSRRRLQLQCVHAPHPPETSWLEALNWKRTTVHNPYIKISRAVECHLSFKPCATHSLITGEAPDGLSPRTRHRLVIDVQGSKWVAIHHVPETKALSWRCRISLVYTSLCSIWLIIHFRVQIVPCGVKVQY